MDDAQSASVFRALADPTRRQILLDLRDGELAAGEIAAKFPISGPSVSRHLAILRAAGLVTERRAANRIYYAVVTDCLAVSVGEFIASICPGAVVMRSRRTGRAAGSAP
jgi:DNA-binding transcriptional ArsR family regulator